MNSLMKTFYVPIATYFQFNICFIVIFYYPPEVRRGEYSGLGVFLLQYFPLVNIWKILQYNCINI